MFIMIEQISDFFTIEMIYLWLNLGVLPFWFTLIFFPQSKICNYLIISIIPTLILASIYLYLFYLFFMTGYEYNENFKLYFGLNNLHILFEQTEFLLLFWVHFLAINLFCGCWIVKDSQKFNISKYMNFIPLIVTYFVGPLGLFIYWILRIFYSKSINLFD